MAERSVSSSVPDDLLATWAWDDLFVEFAPYSGRFYPPPMLAPLGIVGGITLWGVSVWAFMSPVLAAASAMVVAMGVAAVLIQRTVVRRRRETRVLLKLGRDRLEIRHKWLGVVVSDERVELADLIVVEVRHADGEPHLVMSYADTSVVVPMCRAGMDSARWLCDRIEERRTEAVARRGLGSAEVPRELAHIAAAHREEAQ